MPPKAKRSKSPDSQFLFVNEDASTVTRTTKDAELDRTKQSHVQRQNFARKRRLREQSDPAPQQASSQSSVSSSPAVAGPSSSTTQGGPSQGASYFDIIQNIDLEDPLFQSTSPPPISQSALDPQLSALFSDPFASSPASPPIPAQQVNIFGSSHTYRPGHYFETSSTSYNYPQTTRSVASLVNPSIPLGGFSSPPTNTHRALEQWAPPLIKHYNTVILPEKFWKDTQKVPMGQLRHAPLIHADMQACMTEPAHMYAFLASAAAQMIAREGRLLLPNVSEEDSIRVPLFFKTKAIQALQAKLANGQLDHHTAVDLHRLYAAGIHSDNYEAAEPHFQALLSMVDALGGLSTFDDYQLEKIFMLDCVAALKRLGVPRLVVTLDPGPLPDSLLLDIEHQSRLHPQPGSLLEILVDTFSECQVLANSFADLVQVLRMSAFLATSPHYVHEYYKWFNWRSLIILHRLLSMPLHYTMDDRTDSVRIATAYCAVLLRSPTLGRRAASTSVNALRVKLESTDLGLLWQPRTDCLLWVAVFGGVCCAGGEDLEWFVQLARTAATEIGIGNARELEDFLVAYVYDTYSHRELVAQFAGRVWPRRDP
ncbi:uncharacterized protein Z520_00203 [Fonsecaea multimorphosa CBS 102226]|uniref:Transcription factor domain-containing protein n=1 Tax=Fonsecaea multimorphosa CBS 102226 TaxID=1442371 RepID=A0A0D2J295_9EURO|nr:uncharacterized protein Z520_00203 [Fonsecaea multimorphosa CBS 102226]KIY03512.1 hypothetical protein Z520_00203 [Fonsecaea multimorphosa CBS 102226]OAL32628.1 hypothetical protein AYO22_00241 [Fonsecaea multimorphosa]